MLIDVICIDNSNKPNDIPASKWLKLGNPYTILSIDYMNLQNRILGCKIAEINLDDCIPYSYFRLDRFAVVQDNKHSEEELKKRVNELEESLISTVEILEESKTIKHHS